MKTDAGGQSVQLLASVVEVLDLTSIPYAVIGAMAVSYHGIVRASMDVDCIISLQSSVTPEELISKFKNLDLSVEYRQADFEDPLLGLIAVTDEFGNSVDILLGIKGVDSNLFERVKTIELFNRQINIVGVEDLIAMKVFAGSQKDLDDVRGILLVSAGKVDLSLAQTLTKNFGEHELALLNEIVSEVKES